MMISYHDCEMLKNKILHADHSWKKIYINENDTQCTMICNENKSTYWVFNHEKSALTNSYKANMPYLPTNSYVSQ